MTHEESHTFFTVFTILNHLIEKIRHSLNQIAHPAFNMTRTFVVAHGMVNAATMQLHNTFAQDNDHSKTASLSAARAVLEMVGALNHQDFAYINPIMGVSFLIPHLCVFGNTVNG
jgi:hypothetical protein